MGQDLWDKHLKNPALAPVAESEDCDNGGSSAAGGSSTLVQKKEGWSLCFAVRICSSAHASASVWLIGGFVVEVVHHEFVSGVGGALSFGRVPGAFLEDVELAKMALCCHFSLDLQCEEMPTAMGAGQALLLVSEPSPGPSVAGFELSLP